MDQAIRNKLRGVVTQCRRLLEDSVSQELQGKFGIYVAKKDGVQVDDEARMTHLGDEERTARRDILDHFAHIKAQGFKLREALDQLVREVAYTHLNRLCAYKMMEARQVYVGDQRFREAVSRGVNSNGVKFYLADHPDDERLFTTGKQDVAYRHFLDWLGGLLSEEIGVLFSPHDPANRLYPPQRVLDEVLALLNDEALADIWTQDETIGWVYQYFTPKELRDQARKESQAPRNSYELAFRNQFFTPRYVVEFLTDNTLGRIWYEMRKGDTKLKDQCRYMVRRPSEFFLAEGQEPPKDTAEGRDDLPQEELLKLPVYIPHRPKKDPRELKILDPACGSGHFLLYCFDLLLTIYEEAYADPALGPALQRDYPTLDALRRDVPRLILAHNLHGIDIDLRASQIAALALWLRCQRAYQDMGLKKDRPKITRSNIVCAEPMPGEEHMLKEFVGQIEPKLLGQLIEVVFDKMKLAGEAGSLLKIEEEIRDAVADAKRQWLAGPVSLQRSLFDDDKPVVQQRFDFSGITDAQFFEQAEAKVVEALRSYAERAQNGQRLQRRLFAEDAVRGFAFVDLCHKRFDVVLMNPPFGDSSKPAKGLIEKHYPRTKNDLYAAFVERGINRLDRRGLLGAITSRTGFFLSSFQKWREDILMEEASPTFFADLGYGVLDTAMVETAAYCLAKGQENETTTFYRLLQTEDKGATLRSAVDVGKRGEVVADVFHVDPASFKQVPGSPFAYWVSERVRCLSKKLPPFEGERRAVRVGLQTSDDDRFIRCWWEVRSSTILDGCRGDDWRRNARAYCEWCQKQTHSGRRWIFFPKGGPYSPFYADIHLVVNWGNNGQEMKEFAEELKQRISSPPGNGPLRDFHFYFHFGLTWSYRTHRLCLQELPAATIISTRGSGVFADQETLKTWLGLGNSEIVDFLVKIGMGREGHPQFDQGDLKQIPYPSVNAVSAERIGRLALDCLQRKKWVATSDESSVFFLQPPVLQVDGNTIRERVRRWAEWWDEQTAEILAGQEALDDIGYEIYELTHQDIPAIKDTCAPSGMGQEESPLGQSGNDPPASAGSLTLFSATATLMSYSFGTSFGRWDVRKGMSANGVQSSHAPFAPLPACSPGMLQGDDGLLLTKAPEGYPLRIDGDGLLVDDADHSDDIVRRVRDVLEVIWKNRTEAIEKEACEILGVKELRDYFRKPGKGGFWDDHVSRYSKSRRKAPIYWLLQSSKKNYALWLYYHRLDKDLLFKALVNYVEPKIRLEDSRLETLRTQKAAAGASGRDAKRLGKEVERQEEFLSELRDFEDKLRRAANLHLDPDLNDGVVLNIAPLHELVPWKEAKKYWQELLDGQYEWSSIGKQLRVKGIVTGTGDNG